MIAIGYKQGQQEKTLRSAVAATKKEKTVRFLFSSYLCIPAVKLNIELEIVLLVIKTNMNIIDEIALLAALY